MKDYLLGTANLISEEGGQTYPRFKRPGQGSFCGQLPISQKLDPAFCDDDQKFCTVTEIMDGGILWVFHAEVTHTELQN